MKIAVYCSAKDSVHERYKQMAARLGTWIGEHGHTLVYGGATGGLMTSVSNAAKAAGATAVCGLSEATEEACLRQRRGRGGGGARKKRPCMSERETQRPLSSRDLPESLAITIVPPKGAKGASYASVGKDKAAIADTALPSCL